MGMDKGGAKLLLKESTRRPFEGRLLTLGRQEVHFTYDVLVKSAEEMGAKLYDPGPITLSHHPVFALQKFISDDSFFKSLGFSDVAAMDYSSYESARYIFDLNCSEVPEHLLEAFDVIIDGGTIEHVFHVPNALNNIHKMLRQNGRIIHMSPSSNYMDHGFYMFSPTLFWDFYKTNEYEINTFQLIRHTQRPTVDPWEISDYTPGCLNDVSFGGLDDGMYAINCVATKKKESTGDRIPQQGLYMNIWGVSEGKEGSAAKAEVSNNSKYQVIKDVVKRVPLLSPILRHILARIRSIRRRPRKKGLGLKVVARY